MQLELSKLQPFLRPNPLPQNKKTLVNAWAPVLALLLTKRYGESITDTGDAATEPVFVSSAASAIQRRLDKPNQMINAQSVNGASATYNASLLAWFDPAELSELDSFAGKGGIRTVRTPAPDRIRYGNLTTRMPEGSNGF